jgi:hypothetical protein
MVVFTFALPFKRFPAKKEREMSEHRPVAAQRIARMLRELERGANPTWGYATNVAKPATDRGAHLKGQMAPNWLLADNAGIFMTVKKLWVLR